MSNKTEHTWNNSEYKDQELDSDKINHYKKSVVSNWNKSRDSIIEVGRILQEAKQLCHKGLLNTKSWLKLVEAELPFGKKTADRLIAISNCEWITSGEYNDSLPVSWGTLYEISRLTKDRFVKGIESNTIHSTCTRSDIEKYVVSLEEIQIPDLASSNASASGAVTTEQPKKGNKGKSDKGCTFGDIYFNESNFKVGDSLDMSRIEELQQKIILAVAEVDKDVQVDFSSYNNKVAEESRKASEQEWKDTVTKGYNKLANVVVDNIQNDPKLSDEYYVTPEKQEKMKREFFLVPDLNFLAQKVVKHWGVDCLDNALKDVNFPKDYYVSLKKTSQVAA